MFSALSGDCFVGRLAGFVCSLVVWVGFDVVGVRFDVCCLRWFLVVFVVFVRFGGLWFWFGLALGFSVVAFLFWAFCLVRFGCWFDCGVWGLWLACCLIR